VPGSRKKPSKETDEKKESAPTKKSSDSDYGSTTPDAERNRPK
jgi:hypothetical protein